MKAALQGMAVCCNWCTWQVHAQDQHISPELTGDLMLLDTEQMRFSRQCKQELVLSKAGLSLDEGRRQAGQEGAWWAARHKHPQTTDLAISWRLGLSQACKHLPGTKWP